MANSSIFSGIGGFGSNVISPLDFMGGFGYALPWIPTVGAAGAPNEPRRATPIPKVTIDPDQDSPGHRRQVRARAEAEGRRDAQSGRPLLEEVPGDEGEAEHWTRVARRDAQIAEYQKIAADPDYEPDTWYIDHWDIHHWSEKIPPGVPIVAQAGTARQAGVAQAGTQRPPWTGPATWSGVLPSEALLRESAETPPDEPAFGQDPRGSWDPLGIEGYEAVQGSGLQSMVPGSYAELGEMFSSIPTTTEEVADIFSEITPFDLAKGAYGLSTFALPAMPAGSTFAFNTIAEAMAKSRKNERIRSQFPELGPAERDFFGMVPDLDERDYATLAEHGRTTDFGAGTAALSVTPEGFQARPSPVRQRYDETQLGVTPGDMAYDNYMAAHAQMLVPGDPRHTLTQAALDQYGLPAGSTQADLFSTEPTQAGGERALDFGAVPGGIDRWGDPAAPRTVDERLWENTLAEVDLLGEWDPVTEPITGTTYNPDTGQMDPFSTADFSFDIGDPYSAVGLEAFGYAPGTDSSDYAQLDKNAEVIAQYHADQEAVSKGVAGIPSLTPGDFTSYTDFSVKGDREKAGREATARAVQAEKQREREAYVNLVKNLGEDQHAPPPPPGIAGTVAGLGYMWGGGQGEDDSYGFGSMDDTDYGMGY